MNLKNAQRTTKEATSMEKEKPRGDSTKSGKYVGTRRQLRRPSTSGAPLTPASTHSDALRGPLRLANIAPGDANIPSRSAEPTGSSISQDCRRAGKRVSNPKGATLGNPVQPESVWDTQRMRIQLDAYSYELHIGFELSLGVGGVVLPPELQGQAVRFNCQWPFSGAMLKPNTILSPFIGDKQYLAIVVKCHGRSDTLPPLPSPAFLPSPGQFYVTQPNERGRQYLLRVGHATEGPTSVRNGIDPYTKLGDEVIIEELGTKFWMRILSRFWVLDDMEEEGHRDAESYDDCSRELRPAADSSFLSWITDEMLRPNQAGQIESRILASLEADHTRSRHGLLSTASAVEAISPAVLYMATAGQRRQSWDDSWMPQEFQGLSLSQSGVDTATKATIPQRTERKNKISIDGEDGESATVHRRVRSQPQREKELSAIDDPAIHNIPHEQIRHAASSLKLETPCRTPGVTIQC
ncbi:hypothetical protein NMY22_g16324 [Coprinellus aureogranulatus]|nr:hypothetical protein NMY22_g16324 [Coprinellus aureogranulatus]